MVPGYGGGMASAKASLECDSRAMSYYLGEHGHRVNIVSAGRILLVRHVRSEKSTSWWTKLQAKASSRALPQKKLRMRRFICVPLGLSGHWNGDVRGLWLPRNGSVDDKG